MIPPLRWVRLIGTAAFDADAAKAVIDSLHAAVHRYGNHAISRTPQYTALRTRMTPYIDILSGEAKAVRQVETYAALTKYWIDQAWGEDLYTDPRDNQYFDWQVNPKNRNYSNREGILPQAEANVPVPPPPGGGPAPPSTEFREYRPGPGIPNTVRLFDGTLRWWLTDGGTHGGRAVCRAAPWFEWSKAGNGWRVWNIPAGRGHGVPGAAVAKHADATLPPRAPQETCIIKLMIHNIGNVRGNEAAFSSAALWNDANDPEIRAMMDRVMGAV